MFLGRKKVSLNQLLYPSLCSVYGLGKTRRRIIMCKLGCVRKTKLSKIQSNKRSGLSRFINKHFSTYKQLIKPIKRILQNHRTNGTYKGIRMTQGLPSNGQRTHSNASTAGRLINNKKKPTIIKNKKK
jgi:small subunit ribosomal protein S13